MSMNSATTLISLIILSVLIVTHGSEASLLSKLRSTAEVNATQMSPSPAPIYETKPNQEVEAGKPGAEKPKNPKKPKKPKKPDNSSDVNPGGEAKPVNETDLNRGVVNETCGGLVISRCAQKNMTACIKHSEGSQDLIILVKNEGESTLNVSITAPTSIKISTKELEIPGHKAKKVNALTNVGESLKIILNAGPLNCVLNTAVPISQGNFFQKIPYADLVTPMYGAYFMFGVFLIAGGIWACCKFGRKGRHDTSGVPYQELEMAVPVSASAGNGNAEEGWDQVWDDNWDEEGAVKSSGKNVGNVSGNGLTSRSSNKDGWDNDWDD